MPDINNYMINTLWAGSENELSEPKVKSRVNAKSMMVNFKHATVQLILRPVADTGIRQWGGGGGGGGGGRLYWRGRIFWSALFSTPPPPPTVPLPSTPHRVWNSGARHKLTFHASIHAINNLIIF